MKIIKKVCRKPHFELILKALEALDSKEVLEVLCEAMRNEAKANAIDISPKQSCIAMQKLQTPMQTTTTIKPIKNIAPSSHNCFITLVYIK